MNPDSPSPRKEPDPNPAGAPPDQAAAVSSPKPEEGMSSSAVERSPSVAEKEEKLVLFALDESEPPFSFPDSGSEKKVNWLITFADLNNLLCCFFIMLFASSQLDLQKFRLISQSMSSAFSGSKSYIYVPIPLEEAPKMVPPKETDMTSRLRRTLVNANQLRTALSQEIRQNQLDIEVSDQLITIHILQNGSFEAGSSTLDPNFPATAEKIRDVLAEVPGDITVAGHADSQPVSGGKFRSNWELSSARASALLHELLKDDSLPKERFVLKAYGDTRPRLPNTSQANREKNRRVEIIIDQSGLKDNPELIPTR